MPGLYLHIPFCEHKCIYCDFYSIAPGDKAGSSAALTDRFLAALSGEIHLVGEALPTSEVFDSIFFGGGTPSLLEPSQIASIIEQLASTFSLSRSAEVTLETNPGTVDEKKLRDFREAGVNRISVGIQSFHDDDLRFLSRIHSASEAKSCVRNAYRAGFDNVSFDLIFALPSQTEERWRSNLEQALELNPTHISCYSLIVEPNTPLYRMVELKQVTPVDTETDAALYELTMGFLSRHGYEQYEVSNFARPGFRSRHNSTYWHHDGYLGFGPSAHSFWSGRGTDGVAKRWWNVANVVGYAERIERGVLPIIGEEMLSAEQLMEEEIFLGLRSDGIDIKGFRQRHGKDFVEEFRDIIDELLNTRLASFTGERLQLTSKGYLLCDELASRFNLDDTPVHTGELSLNHPPDITMHI